MPSYIFPGEHVFWTDLENHAEIKNKIAPMIENLITRRNKDLENTWRACKVKFSTFDKGYDLSFLEDNFIQNEVVWKPIREMYEQVHKDHKINIPYPSSFSTDRPFINIYNEGDFQEIHNHVGEHKIWNGKIYKPIFSLVYILHESDEDKTGIMFRGTLPEGYRKNANVSILNTFDDKSIKEGTVLIFPASLDHMVSPVLKSGRTTIVYNILANWDN